MTFSFIKQQLAQKQASNLYRQRNPLTKGTGRLLEFDGEQFINFSSNDYLGLSQHPQIIASYKQALDNYGCTSASSSLVTGYTKTHQQLEQVVAYWLGTESCMLFSTGFSANNGFLSAFGNTSSDYFLDKLSHASLIDGAFQSNAKSKRFKHNDVVHLEALLSKSNALDKLVVAEGVYSMDGDRAPIQDILTLAKLHGANVLIDDAHGIGVLGQQGNGSLANFSNATGDSVSTMITFGKALATHGAAIAANKDVIDYLVNHCRDYIYSTAMSPANAAATVTSIDVCQKEVWRREKIKTLTKLFKTKLDSTIETTNSDSSILGILVGSEENALKCQHELKKQGFWLTAIRPPTVEKGKSRLRVTVTANHNELDINNLANSINEVLGKCLQN
ncbi:aminotransferase class I/II-fold pyridoxal phosphate-dependent enzyme [Thalassotalea crassostreae]|uniref:aminotransferase class I/II-fold pyridoxal phosphate-dependent enzyme n=1 Tax=Thalassotalea crassostreae TaxID=1763536 RepID=UPI000838715F|nr:8-amino-7-oxononanoate synthase [Thalassotalea crassostreae]